MAGLSSIKKDYVVTPEKSFNNGLAGAKQEETDKSFGGKLKYIGGNTVAGLAGVFEGIGKLANTTIAKASGDDRLAKYYAKKSYVGEWQSGMEEKYSPDKVLTFLGQVGAGVGQSSVLLADATGVPVGSVAFFLGIWGNSLGDAVTKTDSVGFKEYGYGALSAGSEYALEKISGATFKAGGRIVSGVTGKVGKEAVESTATQVAKKGFLKAVASNGVVKNILKESSGEFIEEFLGDFAEVGISRLTGVDKNASTTFWNACYSGLVGFASGGVMSGTSIAINKTASAQRGKHIIQSGNADTMVRTARVVLEEANATDGFTDEVGVIDMLKESVNRYNNAKDKTGLTASTALGEMQMYVAYIEKNIGVTQARAKIMSADDATLQRYVDYVNNSGEETTTIEDLKADKDKVATRLAIRDWVNGILTVDADIVNEARIAEFRQNAENGQGISEETRASLNEAEFNNMPSVLDAERAFNADTDGLQAWKIGDENDTRVYIQKATDSDGNVIDGMYEYGTIDRDGYLHPYTDAEFADLKIATDLFDTYRKVAEDYQKGAESNGKTESTAESQNKATQTAETVANGQETATAEQASQTAETVAEKTAEKTAEKADGKAKSGSTEKQEAMRKARAKPQEKANGKKTQPKKKTVAKTQQTSESKAEGTNDANNATTTDSRNNTAPDGNNGHTDNATHAGEEKVNTEKKAEEKADEKAEEKPKERRKSEIDGATHKKLSKWIRGYSTLSYANRVALARMVKSAEANSVDTKTVKQLATAMVARQGLDIRFSKNMGNKNGAWTLFKDTESRRRLILLNPDSKVPLQQTFLHEFIHDLSADTSVNENGVIDLTRKAVGAEAFDGYINAHRNAYFDAYAKNGNKNFIRTESEDGTVTRKFANAETEDFFEWTMLEEATAELGSKLLYDRKFLKRLQLIPKGMFKRVLEGMARWVSDVKSGNFQAGRIMERYLNKITEMVGVSAENLYKANLAGKDWFEPTVENPEDSQYRKKASEFGDVRFSLQYAEKIAQNQQEYLKKELEKLESANITEEDLTKAQNDVAEMVALMIKNKDMLPQDTVGSERNTIVKNGSYDYTIENTTVCVRTLAYNSFVDRVAEKLGRPLSQMESFLVSQKLYDIATDPQCLYCYVSLDRKAYNEFLLQYMDERDRTIKAYIEAGMPDLGTQPEGDKIRDGSLYAKFLHGRKNTGASWERFLLFAEMAKNNITPISKEEIATEARRKQFSDGAEKVREEKSKAKKEKRPVDISKLSVADREAYTMFKYAQSASYAKKQLDYIAYYNEILTKLKQDVVDDLNHHYGLRFYSFSDYTPAFIVENMQQITDASLKGLKGLAYTKDVDFAEIFAPTGININISVYAKRQADGTYAIDERQSAKIKDAIRVRNKYKNVGIVVVATDRAGVEWALAQEWSDVVIPFHIVKTGKDVAKFYKWKVFTSQQSDKVKDKTLWQAYVDSVAETEEGKEKVSKMVYPSEHNNDRETFLRLCRERGLKPRFESFLSNPNYMKLVNETRQSAKDTPAMKPIFDLDSAKRSYRKFVEKGGYFEGWYKDGVDVESEVNTVAEDVRAGKKANEVDYGRQDIGAVIEESGRQRRQNRHHGGGNPTMFSLADVAPVQPSSNEWKRTIDTAEAKKRFPTLWDVTADESEVRNPTQIRSTVSTYRKIYDILLDENFSGKILDASSGLGYGTRAGIEEYGFDVDDIEPYPDKSYSPKYTDYSKLNEKYDVIISNAVLNVIPQDQRDALVVKMGELLRYGGQMFINVRGDDVNSLAKNSENVKIGENEWFVASTGSYQKGFTPNELVAYLKDALGDNFTVQKTTKFGKASAIVTKVREGDIAFSEIKMVELPQSTSESLKSSTDEERTQAVRNLDNVRFSLKDESTAEKSSEKAEKSGGDKIASETRFTAGQYRKNVANHSQAKVYSRGDAEATIDRIASTIATDAYDMLGYDWRDTSVSMPTVEIRGKSRDEVVSYLFEKLNQCQDGKRLPVAEKAADYIVAHAIVKDSGNEALLETAEMYYNGLGQYRKKLSLGWMSSDIRYMTDKNYKSVISRWRTPLKKVFGMQGAVIDDGISPLKAMEEFLGSQRGIGKDSGFDSVEALDMAMEGIVNDQDAFAWIREKYEWAEAVLRGYTETVTMASIGSESELYEARKKIANEILDAFENSGVESDHARLQAKQKQETENRIERQKEYFQKRADAVEERVQKFLEKHRKKLQSARKRAMSEARLYRSGAWLEELVKRDRKANNLLSDERMRKLAENAVRIAKPRNAKKPSVVKSWAESLSKIYRPDNQLLSVYGDVDTEKNGSYTETYYDADVGEALKRLTEIVPDIEVVDGKTVEKSFLTDEQIVDLETVVSGITRLYRTYDTVFIDGKRVSLTETAKSGVENMQWVNEAEKSRKGKNGKVGEVLDTAKSAVDTYLISVTNPLATIRNFERHQPDGILSRAYEAIVYGQVQAQTMFAELMQPFEDFYRENKGYRKKLARETVTYHGLTMTKAQAITLYCTMKQEHAKLGLETFGFALEDRKGNYSQTEAIKDYNAEEFEKNFNATDMKFISQVETFFNETSKAVKNDTDMRVIGSTNVSDDYYFPIRRDANQRRNSYANSGKSMVDSLQTVINLAFNKNRVNKADGRLAIGDVTTIVMNHAQGLATYEHLYEQIQTFDRLLNKRVGEVDGEGNLIKETRTSLAEQLELGNTGAIRYCQKLMADIQGVSTKIEGRLDWLDKGYGKVQGLYAQAMISGNLKTAILPLCSYFATFRYLDPKHLAKGMAMNATPEAIKANLEQMDIYSTVAKGRFYEKGAIRSQTVQDQVNTIVAVTGKGIEATERFMFSKLWNACKSQTAERTGLAVESEENCREAGKLFDKVIVETQSQYVASMKSPMARSNNNFVRGLTMFKSDSVAMLSQALDAVRSYLDLSERKKAGQNVDTELKRAKGQVGRAVASVASVCVAVAIVTQLMRYAFNTDDEDEETPAKNIALNTVNSAMGMFPLIGDVYSVFAEGYDISNMTVDGLNTAISGVKAVASLADETDITDADVARSVRKAIYGVGHLVGVPARNLTNLATGVIRRISKPSMYAYDSIFSGEKYAEDLKKAVRRGDDKMAEAITKVMYRRKKGTSYSQETLDEVLRLYKEGYESVLPNGVPSGYTKAQTKAFRTAYAGADKSVQALVATDAYKGFTDEQRAKAVKSVYATWKAYAEYRATGTTDDKSAVMSEVLGAETFATARAYLTGLKAGEASKTGDSWRTTITKGLKGLGYTADEISLILYSAGYKTESDTEKFVKLINKKGLTDEQLTALAGIYKLTVKNGKLTTKASEEE